MGALLLLVLFGAALSSGKRSSSAPTDDDTETEAERIVRESREILYGERDAYSDDGDEP